MEPLTCVSGNHAAAASEGCERRSFNGAAHLRERKPGKSWAARSWTTTRFNGAAHLRERKPSAVPASRAPDGGASMEPLTCVSGNERPCAGDNRRGHVASMEPLTCVSGNHEDVAAELLDFFMLQWSRSPA